MLKRMILGGAETCYLSEATDLGKLAREIGTAMAKGSDMMMAVEMDSTPGKEGSIVILNGRALPFVMLVEERERIGMTHRPGTDARRERD